METFLNFTGDLYKDGVLFTGGGGSSDISDVTGLQAALDNKLDKPTANSEPSFVDSDINFKNKYFSYQIADKIS